MKATHSHAAERRVPREVQGVMANVIRTLALGLFLTAPLARADEPLDTAALLRRMTDLQRLTKPPQPGERSITHAGRGDGEHTLAGPGVITRICATVAGDGKLKIVADGKAIFDGALRGLFEGGRMPFVAPLVHAAGAGGSSYYPIAFGRECVVTVTNCSGAYAIDVAKLAAAPAPFAAQPDGAIKAALAEIDDTLRSGFSDKQLYGAGKRLPIAVEGQFAPAKKERLIRESIDGGGTIRALYVALTDRTNPRALYALHGCILRIYWDGAAEPAVEAPVCDFFGSGFDLVAVGGLPLGTDKLLELPLPDRRAGQDTFLYCHFPMPFAKGAVIEVENVGTAKFGMLLYIEVDRTPPDTEALRFHARYRRSSSWKGAAPLGKLGGPGRIVGCLLNVDCPTTAAWHGAEVGWRCDDGAGDEMLAADVPSFFGAGLPLRPEGHALHAVTRAGAYGKTSLCRWMLGDSLTFQKSARLAVMAAKDADLPPDTTIASLLYWYAPGDAKHDFKALDAKAWAPAGLRIPGAIEIEGQVRGTEWGAETKQKNAGPVEFSGELAARISTAEPVQIALVAPRAGRVKLKLRVHPRRGFQTIEVRGPDGQAVGTVTHDSKSDGIYDVGEIELSAGENLLTVTCSRPAVLDCWIIE